MTRGGTCFLQFPADNIWLVRTASRSPIDSLVATERPIDGLDSPMFPKRIPLAVNLVAFRRLLPASLRTRDFNTASYSLTMV